jgi:hypothetical protein
MGYTTKPQKHVKTYDKQNAIVSNKIRYGANPRTTNQRGLDKENLSDKRS